MVTDTENRKVLRWLLSRDTGASSKFLASVTTGIPGERHGSHPYDTDDFGRCVRLLERVPSLRAKLHRMKRHGYVWSMLVNEWDQLESLYKEARGWESPCNKRIREIVEQSYHPPVNQAREE
jgi:hypothetical protein